MILPLGEKIIETKKCRMSGQEFFVTDKDLAFLDVVSPVIKGKKYSIPSPNVSPIEMRKTIMSFLNQNKLYKRKCDKTGKEIISMFPPDVPFPVYNKSLWYSDDWNPLEHGQNVDFNRDFFTQWKVLNALVPRGANSRHGDENADYSNNCGYIKDCYLCFNGLYNERCYYCQVWDYSKSCIDCEGIYECENCYALNLSKKSNSCWYSHELTNCNNCILCYDCIGCANCIGCYNQRSKTNYLFNEPATPEVIRKYLHNNLQMLSSEMLEKVITQGIHKYTSSVQSENCFGNEFQSSKNCFDSYYMMSSEDCRYCDSGKEEKDCSYVVNGMKNLTNSYCSLTVGINASHIFFTVNSTDNLSDTLYCFHVFFGVKNCFGCIGLHNHEHHCILNKSYSVKEYEELAGKTIDHMNSTGEWGQFFPREYSPFEYNESLAQEWFPLTKDEAIQGGWGWREDGNVQFLGTSIMPLPINQYDEKKVGFEIAQKNIDELLNGIIVCEVTKKPFKIIRQELAFYIENGIPIPTKHPDQRHKERMDLRNPRQLFERKCDECHADMITVYSPAVRGSEEPSGSGRERTEKVVCETCYQKLVY